LGVTRHELSEAELGGVLTLAPGDELVLDLNERASTGYRWVVEQIDPAVLAVAGSEYRAGSGAPGGPATRRLIFRALAAGITELRLKRSRGDAVDRRVTIEVAIDGRS